MNYIPLIAMGVAFLLSMILVKNIFVSLAIGIIVLLVMLGIMGFTFDFSKITSNIGGLFT